LLAFKDVKRLELWARDGSEWRHVRDYPIRGASGDLGPKLQEGDGQVPEGAYQIKGLNPNSAFHLSMELDYPNAWDLEHARAEGRSHPGTDIFIHGASASIGCLAMGDSAIEELFVLVVDVGPENADVYIAPTDLRTEPSPSIRSGPAWLPELYDDLAEALRMFRRT